MTNTETLPSRPLRKDSLRKRLSIIEVATTMFLELGYEKASMNILAQRTGASKSTLYKHFQSKEILFIAVIDEEMQAHLTAIDNPDFSRMDIKLGLNSIGMTAFEELTSKRHISLCRIIYAEAERIPFVGKIYIERGPQPTIAGVAKFLKTMITAGKIKCETPDAAAQYFCGMLLHLPMLVQICDFAPVLTKKRRQAFVTQVVDDFINAFIVAK